MAVSESQLEIPERDEKRGRIRLAPVRGNCPSLFQSAFASETVMYEYDCWADFKRGQRSFGNRLLESHGMGVVGEIRGEKEIQLLP